MQPPSESMGTTGQPAATRPFFKTAYAPTAGGRLIFTGFLYALSAIAAAAAFAAFTWAFWVLLSVAIRAWGGSGASGYVVPGALAALGAWSVLYFSSDRIAFGGGARLQAVLLQKATEVLPGPLPAVRFFVEAYVDKGRLRLDHDIGWLFVYADRLVFVGDRQIITLMRSRIAEPPRADQNPFGLAAAWLTVPLAPPWGRLRLLARDNALRAADTRLPAVRLQQTLNDWIEV